MKIQSIFLTFLIIICLTMAACGSGQFQTPTIVPSPTFTPTPISTPTFTPTPRTQAVLGQAATLYSGPGNVNYESLASLSAGTMVYPSGTYGDFVKVAVTEAGNEVMGFIWKNTLKNPPGSLPVMDRLQVPWEPFFLPTCSPGEYDAATGTVIFASINEDEGYYTLSAVWEVKAPIRIQIKALTAQGSTWSDKWSNTEWSGLNIIGSTEMSIRSRAVDGKYELDIRKSIGGDVAKAIILERSSSRPIQILFDRPADDKPIGANFSVLDETGQVLTTVDLTTLSGVNLQDGLFPNGKLYFSTDTMANSSLVVTDLTIGSQPTGQWVEQVETGPELFRLAEGKHLTIGTDFMLTRAIDRRYCQAMQHDFNLAILSDFSWKSFWKGSGVLDGNFSDDYDFGPVDRAVDFAVQHGWRVRASHLVWGSPDQAIPDWLLNGNYTRDEYIAILENHITTVIGHFRGRVQEWNIANEAIERIACDEPEGYDFWYRKIGPDYIRLAFQTARAEVNPGDILILNSSTNHSDNYPHPMECRNRTIKDLQDTVMALNAGEIKLVDVIGMQMHLLTNDIETLPQKTDVITIMQGFSQLGVRVYITEMDVNLTFVPNDYPTIEDRWAYQAEIYRDMVDACLESGACDSFATWGISDSMSWLTTSCPGCWNPSEPYSFPLMFDDNFLPKPAYFAVKDVLSGLPPGAPLPTLQPTATGRPGNLALGKPVTASSIKRGDFPAEDAVDGKITTRWSSGFSDPQWIQVDLGAIYHINRVLLDWEASYGVAYEIQVSSDGSNWETVYSTTSGDGGIDDLSVSGSGRYVRMYGTSRVVLQGASYGYSLWEFEVYGVK
jgi:GH35 family endo-1,4-beta-xylanase